MIALTWLEWTGASIVTVLGVLVWTMCALHGAREQER